MYTKNIIGFVVFTCMALFLIGCGSDSSPTPVQLPPSTSFNSYEELVATSVCNESVNGSVAYTAFENANFICMMDITTGIWIWTLVQENNPQTEPLVLPENQNPQNCPYGILPDGSCNNGMSSILNDYNPAKEVEEGPGYVTDLRLGRNRTYRTVTIGNQVWMAEDLDVFGVCGLSSYWSFEGVNCDAGSGTCEYEWDQIADLNTRPFNCYADTTNCKIAFSQSIQGACPVGWHIPNENEWIMWAQSLGDLYHTTVFKISEDKLKEFGFGFCKSDKYSNELTDFWTSSFTYVNVNATNFLAGNDGVADMLLKIIQLKRSPTVTTMFKTGYASGYDFDRHSISSIKKQKARVRCVKD